MSRAGTEPLTPGQVVGHWEVVRRLENCPRQGQRYVVRSVCGGIEKVSLRSTIVAPKQNRPTCNRCRDRSVEQLRVRPLVLVRCLHPLCGAPVRVGQEARHTADVHERSEHAPRFSEPMAECAEDDDFDDFDDFDDEEAVA